MSAIRYKLNQIARLVIELGLTKTDLYGIGDTTGLHTWGCKYFGYSRSAAVMSIMIEHTIHIVTAINNNAEGIELLQIFLKHQGLVGKAVAADTKYVAASPTDGYSTVYTLADEYDFSSNTTEMAISDIPTFSRVVDYILNALRAKQWTDQSMSSLLSAYSEYCHSVSAGYFTTNCNEADMLRLAVINAATACNKMVSDRPLYTRYMNFIDALVKYGWLADQTDTKFLGIRIRHNTTNFAPPLDWTIYPMDIEHTSDATTKGHGKDENV